MSTLPPFIQNYGLKILWILILFLIGRSLLKTIVKKTIKIVNENSISKKEARQKKNQMLSDLIITFGHIVIYTIILLMILDLFGADIKPILAGAGIIGLAIGFGTQSLVKNLISGLFIIVENQFTIGDEIKVGSIEGKVIKMNLRSTVIEDKKGNHVYITNGSIDSKELTNFSQSENKE